MTKTPKTFENLPNEKRARVLDEATREFAEHGYHQASVNRIVDRLGIAKGSLFKYFGNKARLFEYLFSNAVAEFKQPLKDIRDDASGDFFTRVKKSFLASGAFIDANPRIYRIYLKMLFNENFPFREKFLGEIRRAHAKFLGRLVDDGMASGQLRPGLDRDATVFTIHSTLDRFLQSYAVPTLDTGIEPEGQTLEDKARLIVDLLRLGLAASPR